MVVKYGAHASGSTRKYTGSRAWSHVEKVVGVNKNKMLWRIIKVDCALNTHRNPFITWAPDTQVLVFVNDILA